MSAHILDGLTQALIAAGGLLVRAGIGILAAAALLLPVVLVVFGWQGVHRIVERVEGLRRVGHLKWRQGCYYARNHFWIRPLAADAVRLGVDDLAQRVLPDAAAVLMRAPGDRISTGDWLGEVRCADAIVTLRAPVAGTVLAVNERLMRRPGLLRSDPYRSGWLADVQPFDRSYTTLPTAEQARAWLDEEDRKLTRYLEHAVGVASADGGEMTQPVQDALTPAQWQELRHQFLSGVI